MTGTHGRAENRPGLVPDDPGLVEFLRAREDEREQLARDASGPARSDRWWAEPWFDGTASRSDLWARVGGQLTGRGALENAHAEHIARHDPARVLADVAAKRRIIELHTGGHECSTYDHNGEIDNCTWCIDSWDCSTLRLLALPHADHPDYRSEWAP